MQNNVDLFFPLNSNIRVGDGIHQNILGFPSAIRGGVDVGFGLNGNLNSENPVTVSAINGVTTDINPQPVSAESPNVEGGLFADDSFFNTVLGHTLKNAFYLMLAGGIILIGILLITKENVDIKKVATAIV